MIQITLNFSSIEAARAALLEIPSSVLVGVDSPKAVQAQEPAPGQATAAASAAPKKTVAAKAPAAQSAETPAPASTAATSEGNGVGTSPAASTTASTASSSEPASSVDYPTLQKAVFALAGKSREAAAAVAASLGVKTFKELDASKWAEALGAVTEKLAELEG
jgi:phage-related protein